MKLITPSLYNAFYWYKAEKSSYEDFLRTLNKVSTPPTPAIQEGIAFEKDIRFAAECLEEVKVIKDPIITKIAEIVHGGVWQKTCKKKLGDYLLYGKMDVWTQFKIYDIKHTKKLELMKYKNSIQHLLYMYCTSVPFFDYLISDGKELLIESYNYDKQLESTLKNRIEEMVEFINFVPEFKEAFENYWTIKENIIEKEIKNNGILIRFDEIRCGLVH